MNYDTTLVTPPTGEPIHLDHAKLHCSVTDTDRDTLFPGWIAQAREDAEGGTNRQLLHARYALTMSEFPRDSLRINNRWVYRGIIIPHAPLVGVVSIAYVDSAGAAQTVSSADYLVNRTAEPGYITPRYGFSWPAVEPRAEAITVTYNAGFASPFTADATTDTITVTGPVTFAVADAVRFSHSGSASSTLPGGLLAGTTYYIRTAPGAGAYTLSATSGGSLLDLTTAGSGLNLIGEIPSRIISWMLLQIGTAANFRESSSEDEVHDLQYVDGLLGREKVWLP